jgi:transcriptional regulator with XRE-family HTH domain
VAQLSGLSVAWYTWLEQGRPIRISAHAAKRLALALRLNDVEQTHLLTLADLVQPSSPDSPSPCVSDTLRHIIDSQGYNPAYVMNETWQVLAWNRASHLLFGDFGRARFGDANALRYMFLDPDSRRSIVDWEQHARRTWRA